MRIGVVCEGPTDYPALFHFLRNSLRIAGVNATLKPLFPEMDNTRPEGGWAQVLGWLAKYPPETRIQRFFDGGLFGGALNEEPLDAIIIQLDTDILEDSSFVNFVRTKFDIQLGAPQDPEARSAEVQAVIAAAAQLTALTEADVRRHVIFTAAESTETWCVAAFQARPLGSESLRGPRLTTAFMRALEASESKSPELAYSNVDKNYRRRLRFCEKHEANSKRIEIDCPQFARGLGELLAIASS